MSHYARLAALSFLGTLACLQASAAQATVDYKSVNAVMCQPYGPNTTASELSYNQKGISNPGTANESVLCAMSSDAEASWGTVAGGNAQIYAFFQTGAVPGRIACTAFVSSAAMANGPVYTITVNPADVAVNTRSQLALPLADTSTVWAIGAPTVILCTLTPKVTLGGFTIHEGVATDVP